MLVVGKIDQQAIRKPRCRNLIILIDRCTQYYTDIHEALSIGTHTIIKLNGFALNSSCFVGFIKKIIFRLSHAMVMWGMRIQRKL